MRTFEEAVVYNLTLQRDECRRSYDELHDEFDATCQAMHELAEENKRQRLDITKLRRYVLTLEATIVAQAITNRTTVYDEHLYREEAS